MHAHALPQPRRAQEVGDHHGRAVIGVAQVVEVARLADVVHLRGDYQPLVAGHFGRLPGCNVRALAGSSLRKPSSAGRTSSHPARSSVTFTIIALRLSSISRMASSADWTDGQSCSIWSTSLRRKNKYSSPPICSAAQSAVVKRDLRRLDTIACPAGTRLDS